VYVENLALCVSEIEKAWLPPFCSSGRVPLGARLIDISGLQLVDGTPLSDCEDPTIWMPPYHLRVNNPFRDQGGRDTFPVATFREHAATAVSAFVPLFCEDARRAAHRLQYDAFVEHELPFPDGGQEVAQLLCFEIVYTNNLDHDSSLSHLEVRLKELNNEGSEQHEYPGQAHQRPRDSSGADSARNQDDVVVIDLVAAADTVSAAAEVSGTTKRKRNRF